MLFLPKELLGLSWAPIILFIFEATFLVNQNLDDVFFF
uniref:Uncharacterized protein n=1 Tax=Rhizophora mucronata TaxID=61149 RepID=A0A2P2PJ98_RHIMU